MLTMRIWPCGTRNSFNKRWTSLSNSLHMWVSRPKCRRLRQSFARPGGSKTTKDVQSQRLTVCCHSVGLSTKNEQELGLGFESLVKINDPSPLPIPDRQSKMLPWVGLGIWKLSKMLRPQEGAMAVSWSDLWELFKPHGCQGLRSSDSILWVGPSL